MKRRRKTALLPALAILCGLALVCVLSADAPAEPPSETETVGVLVVVPKAVYVGSPGTITITAMRLADKQPVAVPVRASLKTGSSAALPLVVGLTDQSGRLTAQFDTSGLEPGPYQIEVQVPGLAEPLTGDIEVRRMPVLLIETDKPIYKPGQTVKGRVLTLTNNLKPDASELELEITDAKGVKIFRKVLTANEYGVAPFELPLATELNFGTWKITAESGSASTCIDIRVEKYVLPRFDVDLLTERDYFLVDEQITGTVKAEYFFGKAVDGTVELHASRYIGDWEQYATYTATLSDGSVEFILPPVGYVSGTSGAGGAGSVQLEVTVTDTSGHDEKTTKLLTITESKIQHQLIAESRTLTPGRPFDVWAIAQAPDGEPLKVSARLLCQYYDRNYSKLSDETVVLPNLDGSALLTLVPPDRTWYALISSSAYADGEEARAELDVYASYSPSDSFLHLSRASSAPVNVGDTVEIDVFRTHDATVYFDVFANGRTVFSDAQTGPQISFQATAQMVPAAKVVAYIINPNNEISADSLTFDVVLRNPARLEMQFSAEQVAPGEPVRLNVEAETQAMVGIAIVDESVYALNEGRLNMQQVFDELERRFMEPQVEVHSDQRWYQPYGGRGAYEIFDEAGLQILSSDSLSVPQGRELWWWDVVAGGRGGGGGPPEAENGAALAEVTRVRQFFPETWLWTPDLLTAADGTSQIDLTAPDSITTWRLHAVSTSGRGLGMAEAKLLVFQEFFGEPDLPYAVTRGEQFPIRIQVFNYLDKAQLVHVELTDANWFELLDPPVQKVSVPANSVGLASFLIQPKRLGHNTLEVALRSTERADAVRKEMLVEPEGTRRQLITNGIIRAGQKLRLDANIPPYHVPGSEKLLLSITPSLVAQSINGIDDLLQMPYGCGEQNMIFFAPDVEILRYLDASGQLTPEIRAKAEHFITCGYQRELTYRREDGSFSAFGDRDDSGSLWLTAFVLGTFSGARDVQTIDETVLAEAAAWIIAHQLPDGSWEPVGFLHHKDMAGGAEGVYALTAFVTIALADYGSAEPAALAAASQYLSDNLAANESPYTLAIAALAFVRTGNAPAAEAAITRLLELAITDGDGIHWEPHAFETTAYAALAMIEAQKPQANGAIKWLSLQQNSKGGFGSTQDTVMALKALMTAARTQSRNVGLTVSAEAPDGRRLAEFAVNSENFDVLQVAELPTEAYIELTAEGSGETKFQLVRCYNVLLKDQIVNNGMALEVIYDTNSVEVDDIVNVTAVVRYFAAPGESGMMIVDVGVPTGFQVVSESLDTLVDSGAVSRAEVAGRKVILYIDGMTSGEQRAFTFQVKARFPVRAVVPDSKAYLYYEPEIVAEAAGRGITVTMAPRCVVDFHYLAEFANRWLQQNAATGSQVDFGQLKALLDVWLGDCPAGP